MKQTFLYEFKSSDANQCDLNESMGRESVHGRRPVYGKRYHEVKALTKFRPGRIS